MRLNQAIEVILDFYLVEVEGDSVVAMQQSKQTPTVEVWAAMTRLAQRTGRMDALLMGDDEDEGDPK
jgi:hypothetical protein